MRLITWWNRITKQSILVTCPKCFSFLLFYFQTKKSKKACQWSDSDISGTKTTGKKNCIVKNRPHPSGSNLEHKNKKKWTQAETNTWSKARHSLLFEQPPDKIAQSYQRKMNPQEEASGGVSSMWWKGKNQSPTPQIVTNNPPWKTEGILRVPSTQHYTEEVRP